VNFDEGLDLLDVLVDVRTTSELSADIVRGDELGGALEGIGVGKVSVHLPAEPNQRNCSWACRIAASRSVS